MNCRTYLGADCDTDHQLLVATLKVRLGKRRRQNSIPPLNLEELKEDKAVQFAAEVTNRFTALEAAQNEVTRESWTLRKNEETRLDAFEMKGLRRMWRVSWTA